MWSLWRTAQETKSRPSDLLCVEDRLTAYLFDSAVVTFGTIIDNLRQEQVKVGPTNKPEWVNKYTLPQLLEPTFTVAAFDQNSGSHSQNFGESGLAAILALAGQPGSGVKQWEYVH